MPDLGGLTSGRTGYLTSERTTESVADMTAVPGTARARERPSKANDGPTTSLGSPWARRLIRAPTRAGGCAPRSRPSPTSTASGTRPPGAGRRSAGSATDGHGCGLPPRARPALAPAVVDPLEPHGGGAYPREAMHRTVLVAQRVRSGRYLELKFTVASVAQPTPWIQTFWSPGTPPSMSWSATIIWAVKDSSLPSPAR
jgi:hypothetical protein